jgi:hypothetical protein
MMVFLTSLTRFGAMGCWIWFGSLVLYGLLSDSGSIQSDWVALAVWHASAPWVYLVNWLAVKKWVH